MSIPPGTDTEKSSIGGVRLLNGIAQCTHEPQTLVPVRNTGSVLGLAAPGEEHRLSTRSCKPDLALLAHVKVIHVRSGM